MNNKMRPCLEGGDGTKGKRRGEGREVGDIKEEGGEEEGKGTERGKTAPPIFIRIALKQFSYS